MHDIMSPFPVCEYTLCCFAAYLADEGLSPKTVKLYLSAVRNFQLSLGLPDQQDRSSLPVLKRVLTGISQTYADRHKPLPRSRLPITFQILSRIHEESTLIWSISAIVFFRFFRLGELLVASPGDFDPALHLSWGDVTVNNRSSPTMVKIHLRQSKCDQFGRGVNVVVAHMGTSLCPVSALRDYIRVCQDAPIAFFHLCNGPLVSKQWFVGKIRLILSSLGFPHQDYAGHSFRIGVATTAAMAGVEDSTIQSLGRWRSSAFLQYIRMPQFQLAAISSRMASASAQPPASKSSQPYVTHWSYTD